jgi:ubiquinone/menaquinone biosynthesis C-methylase UbiE
MTGDEEWSASFASASTNAMSFYDEIMVPRMFEPWAELLLDQLNLRSGEAVLDVACGPGTVTRRAALRVGASGSVMGCDLSPAMLDLARAKVAVDASAPIHYLHCAADALNVADESFDVVTCQQGLQFFPDRPAALAEMRRALRPGGRLGIAVWADIKDCPPFAALAEALRSVLGDDVADTYEGGPWGFGDAESLARLVNDSGFANVEVRRHELPLIFEGGPAQLMLTLHAASVATILADLPEADTVALAAALEEAVRPLIVDGAVRSHATSNILTATSGDQSD